MSRPTPASVPDDTLAVVSYSTLSAIAALLGAMELLPAPRMFEPEQAALYKDITDLIAKLGVLLDRFVLFPSGSDYYTTPGADS